MKTSILAITLSLALGAAQPGLAQDAQDAPATPDPALQPIRSGDIALSCGQIASEALELSQKMGGEPEGGMFGSLGGVARAGAALLIPGAGLAMAGADVLTRGGREREEAEAQAVQNRWYFLNGLYAGQRCQPPPATASAAPAQPRR